MIENNNGHRTYKQLIQSRTQYVQPSGISAFFLNLLSYGIMLPVVGRLFGRSFLLLCYALGRFRRKGDYDALYDLLIDSLIQPTFRNNNTDHWWYLMRFAIAIAQERQINWLVRDIVLEDNLTLIGSLGPRPLKGYDVAYSFVGFSLWLFERGDVWGAINLVKIAEEADPTWGYSEYLHGWYGLFTSGVDSVSHFSKAVNIDWSFLQRMKQDKTCRQHPEVLHEVQKRSLVAK
jgi:hypothetical protein